MREKTYKILKYVIISEYVIVFILSKANVFDYLTPENSFLLWVRNAVGTFVFFLPVQVLLYLLGKDEKISDKKRFFSKLAFWFITITWTFSAVITLFNNLT